MCEGGACGCGVNGGKRLVREEEVHRPHTPLSTTTMYLLFCFFTLPANFPLCLFNFSQLELQLLSKDLEEDHTAPHTHTYLLLASIPSLLPFPANFPLFPSLHTAPTHLNYNFTFFSCQVSPFFRLRQTWGGLEGGPPPPTCIAHVILNSSTTRNTPNQLASYLNLHLFCIAIGFFFLFFHPFKTPGKEEWEEKTFMQPILKRFRRIAKKGN